MNWRAQIGNRDKNEKPIVDALEAAGAVVVRANAVDLIVAKGPVRLLMEVKVPGQEKALTKDQITLRDAWGPQFVVVSSPLDALRACGIQVDER